MGAALAAVVAQRLVNEMAKLDEDLNKPGNANQVQSEYNVRGSARFSS